MCLAIPGKIKKIEGKKVIVKYPGEIREVLIGDKPIKVGNWVLVQMGVIIKIISSKEAQISLKAWQNI